MEVEQPMANESWDPFREMVSLRDAVNSLLQESFIRPGSALATGGPVTLPLDIAETENEFVIQASLPGVQPEDVQITVHGDTLTIRGEGRVEPGQEGRHWLLRERRFGPFQRSISLTVPVSSDRASAQYENGVLTLTLPKAEQAKPKQIKIGGATPAAGGQKGQK
jgi:HSP20 family protein